MIGLSSGDRLSLSDKIRLLDWGLVVLIAVVGLVGVAMLYSAGGQDWRPWAGAHLVRLTAGLFLMLLIALIDIRLWFRLAYPLYGAMLLLLLIVEAMGQVGMGAQRWINLGFFVLQPSELMKITLVLALARYFHGVALEEIGNPLRLIPPLLMIALPVGLVLLQPNLGTAMLLLLASGAILLTAGVRWWKFVGAAVVAAILAPMGWFMLHDYQRARITTFLDAESDPLGAGYNILQSKIALGSGGLFGKGFGLGTQSQLQFLPEKHTDFIFVVLSEEFGLVGAIGLLLLYAAILAYGYMIAFTCRSQFGRLTAIGITTSLFLYVFANVAMVTGAIPVVGIPLPLVSYGGTAMLTLLAGCGLLLGISLNRNARISRTGSGEL